MNETTSDKPIKDRSTWMRILFMVLFVVIYGIAETVLTGIVVVQIVFKLVTGDVNERLLTLSKQASTYIYNILLFLTFNSEERPFPFSDWPE